MLGLPRLDHIGEKTSHFCFAALGARCVSVDDENSIHAVEPRSQITIANANELFHKEYRDAVRDEYCANVRQSMMEGLSYAEVDVSFIPKQDIKRRNSKAGPWWTNKIKDDAIPLQEASWARNLTDTSTPPITQFPKPAKDGIYCVRPKPNLEEQYLTEAKGNLGPSGDWILKKKIPEIIVWDKIIEIKPPIRPLPIEKSKPKTKNQKNFAIEPIVDPILLESIYSVLEKEIGDKIDETIAFLELLLPEVIYNSVVTGHQKFALQCTTHQIWKCTVNLLKFQ